MFDVSERADSQVGFDHDLAVDAFRDADRAKLVAECDQFRVAAYWPDQYDTSRLPLIDDVETDFRGERAVRLGGPGCPPVAEFTVASFAAKVGWSIAKMRYLMADAVDARHRLPRLFDRVRTGHLPRWTVQQVSRETRDLTLAQAGQVDDLLAAELSGLSGVRLERRIAAAVITVDPERYARLVEKARRSRYFHRGQANEHGLAQVYAQLDRADALRLEAMVKRIRTILVECPRDLPGIPDRSVITGDEWDAIALGVLADPIRAARLLIEYEQPDLFGDLVDLFTPPEDQPRTTDGPGPSDYPTNTPDAPAHPDDEPPVEEPPPDPYDIDLFAEPNEFPGPLEIPEPEGPLNLSRGSKTRSFRMLRKHDQLAIPKPAGRRSGPYSKPSRPANSCHRSTSTSTSPPNT